MKSYSIIEFAEGGALIILNGRRVCAYITNILRARLLCAYLNGEI